MALVVAADHAASFALLQSGAVDAFATDDVLLYGLVAQNKAQDEYVVVGDFLSYDPYGVMFRKGDAPLAALVNDTFRQLAEDARDRAPLHALVPEEAALGREPRPADEPAARAGGADARGAARLAHASRHSPSLHSTSAPRPFRLSTKRGWARRIGSALRIVERPSMLAASMNRAIATRMM